jgi:DNA-binding CsgD family transcriptional regulator
VAQAHLRPDDRATPIGRAVELDVAVDHLVEHGSVLVTGEPGIGKSTLLDAIAARLDEQGFVVVRATGNHALVDHPLAALGHLIGDPGDRTGPALAALAHERLRGLARGSGSVIIVDDAHALDAWSLQAIHQARLDHGPRVVLAARSSVPLADTVATFGRHPGARLQLQRLSRDETASLAESVLDGPLDTPSASRIHQATDGLPLAVVELVRYAARRGALVERSGLLRWTGGEPVDRHLAGLLGLRVDELASDERDVVDALAVVGELPGEVLTRIAPQVDLVTMERQRLIRATPRPGWLMVGHPLLRDAAEAMLAPVRRRQLSLCIVDALDGADDPALQRLAVVLAVDIGAAVDPEALLSTVRWARAHALWRQFLPVMERAWVERPTSTSGLAYGEALYWTRDMTRSADVFAAAETLCATDRERISIATARARTLEIGLGRADDAESIRRTQLSEVTDPADRLEALCAQTERWLFDGEVERILEVRSWVASVDTADGDTSFAAARYRFTQSSVAALGLAGRLAEMADEYALHLALAEQHAAAHPLGREVVDPWWAACNLVAGRPDPVRSMILDRYETAIAVDDGLQRPLWALPRAIERLLAGDLVAAEHFAREAMGVPAAVVSIRRMATHYLARTLELAGRLDEAATHARATAGDDYVGIVRSWSAGIEHRCTMGTQEAIAPATARQSLQRARDAVTDALDRGQRVSAAHVAHDLTGWEDDRTLAALLGDIASNTDAPSVRWMAAHARARAGGRLSPLIDAADEAAGADLHGVARTLADAAADLAVARRDATTAARAAHLLQRCTEITTGYPPMRTNDDVAGRFGLSRREAEIMRAAAAGLTDQEIATDLVISVRTVNAHLRAVYRKVGVTSRRQLRSL